MDPHRHTLCLLATTAFLVWGCRGKVCEHEPPGFQVDLELAKEVPVAKIQTLEASVTACGLHKVANLATGPLKAARQASFVVVVGDSGDDGFGVQLAVQALGAGDEVLARGAGSFSASGDACNTFSLRLTPPAGDGGILDGGADHDAGTGDSCTPQCALKICGAADGCGGTCSAGSGCCVPPKEPCGGTCVNTTWDAKHCGTCNNACAPAQICVNESCVCDPGDQGACSTTSQYCSASSAQCDACADGTFNCDGTGICECIGKCVATTCDTTCTHGVSGQCGSIYHACLSSGVCELCPSGLKNCDQQSGCDTPVGTPCP